jgi:Thioesterase-like superfamily
VQAVPEEAASAAVAVAEQLGAAMPPPEQAEPLDFSLDGSSEASFAGTAMEMRAVDGVATLGPGRVWMRLRYPLLAGQPLTALARLLATADFGNGISASLPFERFVFINADLSVHLLRRPQGEWIGLDARTRLPAGGCAVAESVLHDQNGALGRAFQTLVVQAR